jgi:hypothetical protein
VIVENELLRVWTAVVLCYSESGGDLAASKTEKAEKLAVLASEGVKRIV